MLFLCYPKCSTCRKAQKWLDEHDVDYYIRDIKTENPDLAELELWHQASGLPLKKFFNTSGQLYRSLDLSKKRRRAVCPAGLRRDAGQAPHPGHRRQQGPRRLQRGPVGRDPGLRAGR